MENHKHRSEILAAMDSDIESIRGNMHVIYRGTYRRFLNILDCKTIKDAIRQVVALKGAEKGIKASLEKLR